MSFIHSDVNQLLDEVFFMISRIINSEVSVISLRACSHESGVPRVPGGTSGSQVDKMFFSYAFDDP